MIIKILSPIFPKNLSASSAVGGIRWIIGLLLLTLSLPSLSFTIQEIQFTGLIRLSTATAKAYVPANKRDIATPALLANTVRSLNQSGLFADVQIYTNNDDYLIIELEERPVISEIELDGNELIDDDQLLEVLKANGIARNRTFNPSLFRKIQREMRTQYFHAGYYAVRFKTMVEPLKRQRVRLVINIDEGIAARIEQINFTGNTAFTNHRLHSLFQTAPYQPTGALFGSFDYQKLAVEADFDVLKNYYLDNGYAKVSLRSSQVSLSPEQKAVYINLNIEEGALYHFSNSQIIGYEKLFTSETINKLNLIKKGAVFSRKKITKTINNIRQALGELGFAFANIRPNVMLNDQNKSAFVQFAIDPGERVYVQRVEIVGNHDTLDSVTRRELRQFEGSLYVPSLVQRSQGRINRSGYFSQISIDPRRINNNQVLLIVNVEETNTGSFNAQVGYSAVGGVRFGIGINERNWLGRGYNVAFNAHRDTAVSRASIAVTDPHFREENLSLTWQLSYTDTDASQLNQSDYLTNRILLSFNFGVPFNEQQRFQYGARAESVKLICDENFNDCNDFEQRFELQALHYSATLGWRYDSRNRAVFPTSGSRHSALSIVSIPGSDIDTIELSLDSNWYFPLFNNAALRISQQLSALDSFTDDPPPFYNRFFTGGPASIRGYATNSLGPQYNESLDGSDGATGGVGRINGSIQILIPPFFADSVEQQTSLRFGPFLDYGNVFADLANIDLAEIRASYGVAIFWLSPFGPITLSASQVFNDGPEDRIERIQFSLGQNF